jgi:hypothetical protein
MGTDFVYERGAMALQNCGAIIIGNDIGSAIHWIQDALMCGVGVGFHPTRENVVVYTQNKAVTIFEVQDSRLGWCDSTKALIDSYLIPASNTIEFDYSAVRGPGLPIKGFGGLSSGPKPLINLHENIRKFFYMYLTNDWYSTTHLKTDIANSVGCCTVAGNVRRSAELALAPISNEDFLDLKDYSKNPYRADIGWMSNNSVMLEHDEDFEKLSILADRAIKTADLGFVNLKNFPKGRIGKSDNLRRDFATLVNPCFRFSAPVLTLNGIRKAGEIKVGETVWSEHGWTKVISHQFSGIKPVYKYITTAGCFYGTDNHKVVCDGMKIPVGKAYAIDILKGPNIVETGFDLAIVLDGLVLGDGTYKKDSNNILLCVGENDQDYFKYFPENTFKLHARFKYYVKTSFDSLPRVFDRQVPTKYFEGTALEKRSFLLGLYSANGSISHNRIHLKATSFKLIEQVQVMLSSLGIRSYWTKNKANKRAFKTGGKTYDCKESYNLVISSDLVIFARLIGFIQKYKTIKLQQRSQHKFKNQFRGTSKNTYDIIGQEYLGDEPVYDITVDQPYHTLWCGGLNVANCGEQPLESGECCTLAETLPTRCEDHDDWLKACEYATCYASTVSLLPTHRSETNKVMVKNRRIGIGIIDVSGWKHTVGANEVIKYLRKGYERIRKVNQWLNGEAGVPEAIRVTTVKPSGTVAKLAGRTAGIGHPNFHYTLRRVRVAANSSIVNVLKAANIPWEPDVNDPLGTLVFEWPIEQGPAKPATEVSLWEQAMNVVMMQREWSDNAVSNTLNFRPKWVLVKDLTNSILEIIELDDSYSIFNATQLKVEGRYSKKDHKVDGKKLYKFDPKHEEDDIESVLSAIAPQVKSISLLPQTADGVYQQMPESGISQEEYTRRMAAIKPIDWSLLTNHVAEPDKYCTSESCEVAR